MTFGSIVPPKALRNVILVILYGPELSINYSSSASSETFIITNPNTFLTYIERLFTKDYKEIIVVPVFNTFSDLIPLLKFLRKANLSQRAVYKEIYDQKYKLVLQLIQGESNILASVAYSEGQYDLPICCNLFFVLDSNSLDSDHLSLKNLLIQQYLRFIALQHGAHALAIANFDDFLKCPEQILDFHHTAKPIYGDPSTQGYLLLNLSIPVAWDSWAKILPLSRSVIQQSGKKYLTSEDDLKKFQLSYVSYFEEDKPIEQVLDFVEPTTVLEVNVSNLPPRLQLEDILRDVRTS